MFFAYKLCLYNLLGLQRDIALVRETTFFMKFLKTLLLLIIFCASSLVSFGQERIVNKPWKFIDDIVLKEHVTKSNEILPDKFITAEFKMEELKKVLLEANKFSRKLLFLESRDSIIDLLPTIVLPTPDGDELTFKIYSSKTANDMDKKKPIKVLNIRGFTFNESNNFNLSIQCSSAGVVAKVSGFSGNDVNSFFISDYEYTHNTPYSNVIIFYKKDFSPPFRKVSP